MQPPPAVQPPRPSNGSRRLLLVDERTFELIRVAQNWRRDQFDRRALLIDEGLMEATNKRLAEMDSRLRSIEAKQVSFGKKLDLLQRNAPIPKYRQFGIPICIPNFKWLNHKKL